MTDITELPSSPNGEITHDKVRLKTNELVGAVNADTVDLGLVTTLSDFGGLLSVTNNDTGTNSLVIAGDEIQAEGIKKPNVPTAGPLETIYSQFIDTDTSQLWTEGIPFVFQIRNFEFASIVPTTEYIAVNSHFDLATIPPSGQVKHEVWRGFFVEQLWGGIIDVVVGLNSISPPENHPITYRDGETYYTRTTPVGGGSFSIKGDQPGEIFNPRLEVEGYAIQRSPLLTEADIPSQTIARAVNSQTVPVHNAAVEATEIVIDFGSTVTSDFSIVNGVVEVLREIKETAASIELHIRKEGGVDSVFNCWLEASPDNVVWSLIDDTKRSEVVANGGDTTLLFDFSFNVNVQAGGFFRVVAANTGATALSMERPDDLETFKGQVKGFSKKLRLVRLQ